MNNVNPSALLRSLIVYAICVPLAILVGYMLTNPLDYQSIGFIGVLVAFMVFPLLMKWHYPLLVFSAGFPALLFFLPGHPTLLIPMVAASLSISVVERILDRNKPFLPSGGVVWPLLAFLLVMVITAKLTGGFGLRSMGSDVYGGKKYVFLTVGILTFFAFTARAIPKKYANIYIVLYFAGAFFNVIQDLYYYTPDAFRFIFYVFPPSNAGFDSLGNQQVILGQTRLTGVASAAGAVFGLLIAKNGIRDNVLTTKLWRPVVLLVAFLLMFLGGYRSMVVNTVITLALIFYLERLHRTGLMLVVVFVGITGAALVVPLASHLPYTFQRSLAFLPLDISADARMDAEGSTQWRLDMWSALLPQIPKYLFLGKGYAFSSQTFDESMGANATFHRTIDAADDPLALAGDFHSGPLSVVLSFGLWGVLVWLWFWVAGFHVMWRNYRYGDPDLRHINLYLYAAFISKIVGFLFVFGDVVGDVGGFGCLIGLSIALNHGVCKRPAAAVDASAPKPAPDRVAFPIHPGLPALGR